MHRSISLLFWLGKVRSSWLLPDLADVLRLEDVVLSSCSHQVWCCRWSPCFYGRTLSRTVPAHLYRPAMQKHHKYWHQQNIGARQDFTDFRQTSTSLLTGFLSKIGKSKKRSPSLSNISFSIHDFHTEAVTKILRFGPKLSQWGRGAGGGSLLYLFHLP